MAKAGERIENPYAETLIFRRTAADTNGEFLEMEGIFHTRSERPPEHYHPEQDEHFEVLSGEVWTRVEGEERVYRAGERFEVPAGRRHAMTNASRSEEARISWRVTPALNTATFLETIWGLAREGKTNKRGIPNPLQGAVILRHYRNVIRLTNPPQPLQAMVFPVLAFMGRLVGYKPRYSGG